MSLKSRHPCRANFRDRAGWLLISVSYAHRRLMDRCGIVIVVALWLAGCVYTIDTAVPNDRLRSDATLVGTWYASDSSRVVITAADQGYHLEYRDEDGSTGVFHGRFGRLGERTVLEVRPAFGPPDDKWPMGRSLFIVDIRSDEIH